MLGGSATTNVIAASEQ